MSSMKHLGKLLKIAAGVLFFSTLAPASAADIYVLGGNPSGSLFYAQAQSLATTVNKYSSFRLDVLPQSSTVFFPMFNSKEADFGLASPIDALLALKGDGPYAGKSSGKGYKMQTVMLGSPIRLSLVVRADSDIMKLSDLRNRKVVANYGAFVGSTATALAALANAGLSVSDVKVVNVADYPEGIRAVMEGRADAAVASIGSGVLNELEAQRGARLLPIDPGDEAMQRAQKEGPAFVPLAMKKGEAVGINSDMNVLSYDETIYVAPHVPDKVITEFIDSLVKHADDLPKLHKSLVTWTPERYAGKNSVISFHPAAVKYYKEKGMWSDAVEEKNNQLLKEGF